MKNLIFRNDVNSRREASNSLKKSRWIIFIALLIFLTACNTGGEGVDKSSMENLNSAEINSQISKPSNLGSSSEEEIEIMYEEHSVLSDTDYDTGFVIFGLSPEKDGLDPKGFFPAEKDDGRRPLWQIAQWYAGYSLADPEFSKQETISPGVYQIKSPSMNFILDSNENLFTFNVETSKIYKKPRVADEGWTHLLISQNFSQEGEWTKASTLDKLIVSMDTKLTKFEDHLGDDFNASVHAAQFLMFIVTANSNPESPDYGKYIWFGIGMFDNRNEISSGGAMWDKGTQAMMYGLSTEDILVGDYHYFENDEVKAGEDTPWVSYEVDVLRHLEAALAVTQYKGYLLKTTMDDLSFTAFNLGWEIPGTYDVEMLLRNFKMTAMRKIDTEDNK